MITRLQKNATIKLLFIFFLNRRNFEKLACEYVATMETSSHVDSHVHVKLLPDNFYKNSPSLVAFPLILKKLLTSKVAAGRVSPGSK